MIKIIINGCNGKMGQVVVKTAAADPDVTVAAGIDKFPDTIKNDFPVFENIEDCNIKADAVIDFSRPDALKSILEYGLKNKLAVVIATTGLSDEHFKMIDEYSKKIPVFNSSNMSVGVNLLIDLAQKAASSLGDSYDVEIIEKHHNQKVDAPSGTAIMIADAINNVFLNSKNYVYGRHSKSCKRTKNEIGIHSIRGGTIVGEHQVMFIGNDEIVEIDHIAQSKQIFAIGAIHAAKILVHKKSGRYNMKDILSERNIKINIERNIDEILVNAYSKDCIFNNVNKLFDILSKNEVHTHMLNQSENNVIFTVKQDEADNFKKCIKDYNNNNSIKFEFENNLSKISVIGFDENMQHNVISKLYSIFSKYDIQVKAASASGTGFECITNKIDDKYDIDSMIKEINL